MTLRIATRRSALARAQAFQTGRLIQRRTGEPFELVAMATSGDLNQGPVGAVDVKGMFVDTIRAAVLSGDCHLAVHSYKDLPTDPVEGLVVGGIPPREDPRDFLVAREPHTLATLPAIATVGTSSERRRLQLLRSKPGLQVLPIRGNLDTRLRKVADGQFDAIVIAYAGMRRLYAPVEAGGLGPLGLDLRGVALEPGECLSAPGQGALALECRAGDQVTLGLLHQVDDLPTSRCVAAERSFLSRVGGGCLAAVGALCGLTGVGGLELAGVLGDPVKRRLVRRTRSGPFDDPIGLGEALADELLAAGI